MFNYFPVQYNLPCAAVDLMLLLMELLIGSAPTRRSLDK